MIRTPLRKFHQLRAMFYCNDCWQAFAETIGKPIPGIDRPKHASDFWRPSLIGAIHLALIEERRRERAQQEHEIATLPEQPILRRERELSPKQWAQLLHLRKITREMRR